MTKKVVNIRLEESVWQTAREDAVHNQMTLQDWVTCALLKAHSEKLEQGLMASGQQQ